MSKTQSPTFENMDNAHQARYHTKKHQTLPLGAQKWSTSTKHSLNCKQSAQKDVSVELTLFECRFDTSATSFVSCFALP